MIGSPAIHAAYALQPRSSLSTAFLPDSRARSIASGKKRPGQLGPGHGGAGASPQRMDQQRSIVESTRDRQGLFCQLRVVLDADRHVEHGPVDERTRTHCRRHLTLLVGERSVEPVDPSEYGGLQPRAVASMTQIAMRGQCHRVRDSTQMRRGGCRFQSASVRYASRYLCCPQGSKMGRHSDIEIAMLRANDVGFTGFAVFFLCVLAHRLNIR